MSDDDWGEDGAEMADGEDAGWGDEEAGEKGEEWSAKQQQRRGGWPAVRRPASCTEVHQRRRQTQPA